jgi:hypothetical protein
MTLEESVLTLARSIDALAVAMQGKSGDSPAKPARATPKAVKAAVEPKYDDVREAILAFAERKGMPAAIALLGEFGVTNAKELKPEQYGDALEKARAA